MTDVLGLIRSCRSAKANLFPQPRLLAENVRTLSEVTRREKFGMRAETRVRRVTFDRVVRTKSLGVAADA